MKTRASQAAQGEQLSIAILGAGSLAGSLAPALAKAGFAVSEILYREKSDGGSSARRARILARRVGARAATISGSQLDADVLWVAVPDGAIRSAAESIVPRAKATRLRYAFHSSGALAGGELESLRRLGIRVASVHPLMTFVPGAMPSLAGVPFALEGDAQAIACARRIVRAFGGSCFALRTRHKAAYHAWATMTSPLLLAYLVTLEDAARQAGFGPNDARRMSLPIIRQTIANYEKLGPNHSFSGPFVRGDAETVAKHLKLLGSKSTSKTRAVYLALAREALDRLPVKNRGQMLKRLEASRQR